MADVGNKCAEFTFTIEHAKLTEPGRFFVRMTIMSSPVTELLNDIMVHQLGLMTTHANSAMTDIFKGNVPDEVCLVPSNTFTFFLPAGMCMLREGQFVYLLVEVYEVTPYTTSVDQLCRRVGFRRIIVHPRTASSNDEREPGCVYSLSTAMTLLHSPSSPNCHTCPAQIKFVASLRTVDLPARCTMSVFKTPVSDLPHLPRTMISIKELPNVPLLSRQHFAYRALDAPLLNRQEFVHRELNAALLTKRDVVTDVVHRELPQPASTRVATPSKLPMNTFTSAHHHTSDSLAELLGLEESDEDLPEVMLLTPSPTSFEHDKSADNLPLVMPLTPYAQELPVVIPLTPSPIGFIHNKIAEHLPLAGPLTLYEKDPPVVMPLHPSPVRFEHVKSAEPIPPVMQLTPCPEDLSVMPLNPSPKRFEHEKNTEPLPPVMPLTPCAEDRSVVMPLNPSPKRFVHDPNALHLPLVRPPTPCAQYLLQVAAYVREALNVSLVERTEQKSSYRKQSLALHELPRVPQNELTATEQHRHLSSATEATRIQTTEESVTTKETLRLPAVKTSASYARAAAQETVSFTAVQRLPQPPTRPRPGITFVEAKKKIKKRIKRKLPFVVKRTILDDLPVAIKTVPMGIEALIGSILPAILPALATVPSAQDILSSSDTQSLVVSAGGEDASNKSLDYRVTSYRGEKRPSNCVERIRPSERPVLETTALQPVEAGVTEPPARLPVKPDAADVDVVRMRQHIRVLNNRVTQLEAENEYLSYAGPDLSCCDTTDCSQDVSLHEFSEEGVVT